MTGLAASAGCSCPTSCPTPSTGWPATSRSARRTLSQHAAVAAFDAYRELDDNVARYAREPGLAARAAPERRPGPARAGRRRVLRLRRRVALDRRFAIVGAPSCWPTPASRVAPGVDFDPVDGGRFIRMCFAGDTAEIAQAVDILGDWLS